MSDYWDGASPIRSDPPREFLVSAEFYVSGNAAAVLRKPPMQRKKTMTEKRDSLMTSSRTGDESQKKVKEKPSWMNLSRSSPGPGHWRSATCKLSEEGEKCLLNIYADETILYQTVIINRLNHTDIRQADSSLFQRKDCLVVYCHASHQRWSYTSAPNTDPLPLYLQFANTDARNTWLSLLRSYAIPEVFGDWSLPVDGGLYRMWRQVELTVMQGRNLGNQKPLADSNASFGEAEADAIDLDVSCEIRLNDQICGRTTVKKGIGSPDWHESFIFSDLPPFETLELIVWREKKLLKPAMMGSIRIALSNFRRGEAVEGWFPVLHSGPIASSIQVGDIRMKLRVDEEIILPNSAYSGLLQTINSRNFLDWMGDFENRMQLKSISAPLMAIAVAKNSLIEQIFTIADREVDGTPHSHNTLFRGNTILTKTMELCMAWYGKPFLEASIGNVIRRLCNEKVAIEVDPVRSGKSVKDVEKSVDQLIYWCREFWQQIYAVRGECPHEMRRLFEHIRKLVEKHYRIKDITQDQNKELPWQSVSAFCFLRFIVPAILHPHLFGLCPGLPPVPVQRSLTLIAKVIQSLANLNATVQKEEFMRGVKEFVKESLPGMVDYILVVSTPVPDPYGPYPGPAADRHDRLNVVTALRQRGTAMPALHREAVPLLPHLLDIPRHLAVVTSAVIRSSKGQEHRRRPSELADGQLESFITKCFEVEEAALHRVSQLASHASDNSSPSSNTNRQAASPMTARNRRPSTGSQPPPSSHKPRNSRKLSRPVTAPSQSDLSDNPRGPEIPSDASLPSSPVSKGIIVPRLVTRTSNLDLSGQTPSSPEDRSGTWSKRKNKLLNTRSTSTDSIPTYTARSPAESTPSKARESQTDVSDDNRKKKGILRGILTRR